MKRFFPILIAALLLFAAGCSVDIQSADGNSTLTLRPAAVSAEPSGEAAEEASAEPSAEASAEPTPVPTPEPTPVPTPEPTPVPTPAPTPAPVEIEPGSYEDGSGSELTIKKDGTVTYKTEVSGKINGSPMSAKLTFHGAVDGQGFVFDKVTYMGIDLTAIAAANGITDATLWQDAAWTLYLAQR